MFQFTGTVRHMVKLQKTQLLTLNKFVDFSEIFRTSPGEFEERHNIKPTPPLPKGLILL